MAKLNAIADPFEQTFFAMMHPPYRQAYSYATLGVYELTRVQLLRHIFVWAYERSTQEYLSIQHDLAEPDPLRLAYRDLIRQTIRAVVQQPQADPLRDWKLPTYPFRHCERSAAIHDPPPVIASAARQSTTPSSLRAQRGNPRRWHACRDRHGLRPRDDEKWVILQFPPL